ncbi:MAG: transglutaminase family protein [Verrucomicrobiaceae bacterium]|nr:MAG: transglutaminase family protein [Verrucomicrobiaceae bacterium]
MEILDVKNEARERLHLVHESLYTYSEPVHFSPHRLVLRPREGHDVRLHMMKLETFPKSRIHWHRDILDNSIAVAEFTEPSSQLRIRSEFDITLPAPVEIERPPLLVAYPPHVAGIDELITVPYRQFTYPQEVERLRKWFVANNLEPQTGDRRAIFDELAALIFRTIRYTRREESGVQSPVATLDFGSGSCRDMAVLMIETCRAMGYPARFVSGYLESSNSVVGRGSTHAWTEVYLPEKGWKGYDPSTGRRTGAGHVPVGVSHHPRGVMPVTGGYTGRPGVTTTLRVSISTQRLPAV